MNLQMTGLLDFTKTDADQAMLSNAVVATKPTVYAQTLDDKADLYIILCLRARLIQILQATSSRKYSVL